MPRTQVSIGSIGDQARPTDPRFECTLRDGGFDAAWIHLAGELDLATAPLLEHTLSRAETWPRVVLDLRELEFIDCSGLSVIIKASVRATRMCRRLVLVRGRTEVDRVLALTAGSHALEVVELEPVQPPVQALVQLVHQKRAA